MPTRNPGTHHPPRPQRLRKPAPARRQVHQPSLRHAGRIRRRHFALHQFLHRRRLRLDPRLHGSAGRQGQQTRSGCGRSHRRRRPRHARQPAARLRQLRLDHAHDLRPAGAAARQLHAGRRRLALPPTHGAHSQAARSNGRTAHAHRRPCAHRDRRHAASAPSTTPRRFPAPR